MSRLTLEWHLRGIIEGTTEPQDEVVGHFESAGKEWPIRETVDEGSYTTGFEQDSGRFCDVFEVPARRALESGDPVKFLDAVAHDPTRRYQERNDAATLLNYHIWPDSPDAGTLGRADGSCGHADRPDVDVSEWLDAGLVRRNIGPTYLPQSCVNDGCTESECLADPDVLRDEGEAECMVCGTRQPEPTYP